MLRIDARDALCEVTLLLALGLWGCDGVTSSPSGRSLSVGDDNAQATTPKSVFKGTLGVVAERAQVRARPSPSARLLGMTIAGTMLPCSEEPVGRDGCERGWFAVYPRGYVCLNEETTLDPNHPTLKARALAVSMENALPYPYAVTKRETTLYEVDPKHRDGVREQRKLPKGSVFAVVGSWNTLDEFDQRQRLALLTSGQFVSVRDLEPSRFPKSKAVLLDGTHYQLPLAFLRHVAPSATVASVVALSGLGRVVDGERRWAKTAGGDVRESEAIVVRKRQEFPSFVGQNTRFAELDLSSGSLVLYEGKTPTFASIALRLPARKPVTGVSYVRSKQITARSVGREVRDRAWVLELDNGLVLQAATAPVTHDAVNAGEAADAGDAVEFHPDDAKRLFHWLSPELPEHWHGVVADEPKKNGATILLR